MDQSRTTSGPSSGLALRWGSGWCCTTSQQPRGDFSTPGSSRISAPPQDPSQDSRQFPAFLNKPLSLKNVEHALCEYSKYYRMVQGQDVKSRIFKTATKSFSNCTMDDEIPCSMCEEVGDTRTGARVMCTLCRNFQHNSCDNLYATKYCEDGTWLCRRCHRVEEAWGREELIDNFEEVHT